MEVQGMDAHDGTLASLTKSNPEAKLTVRSLHHGNLLAGAW